MTSIIGKYAGVIPLLVLSLHARAETTVCTEIRVLPTKITDPGIYCLKKNLRVAAGSTDPASISVVTDDVVIDLNEHLLDGSILGPATTQDGIVAFGRKHITVRNGAIRGFRGGVRLTGNPPDAANFGEHLVEGLHLDQNYLFGIQVFGNKGVVRGNTVSGSASAIVIIGAISRITDNAVLDTVDPAGGLAVAINVQSSPFAVIERNTISNATLQPGASQGIFVSAASVIVDNRVNNMRTGIVFFGGTGLLKDNIVGGADTPFLAAPPPPPGAFNFTF
jgi:hypothetical protein